MEYLLVSFISLLLSLFFYKHIKNEQPLAKGKEGYGLSHQTIAGLWTLILTFALIAIVSVLLAYIG